MISSCSITHRFVGCLDLRVFTSNLHTPIYTSAHKLSPLKWKHAAAPPPNWASERCKCLLTHNLVGQNLLSKSQFPLLLRHHNLDLLFELNQRITKSSSSPFILTSSEGNVQRVCCCTAVKGVQFGEKWGTVFRICISPSAFLFNVSDETDTRCLRLRKDGVLCTPDSICAAVCCLTCAVVCRCVDLRHNGEKKKPHRMIQPRCCCCCCLSPQELLRASLNSYPVLFLCGGWNVSLCLKPLE